MGLFPDPRWILHPLWRARPVTTIEIFEGSRARVKELDAGKASEKIYYHILKATYPILENHFINLYLS